MKLNGSNSVRGLYNFHTAPEGVLYTRHDIVYYNDVLYTCLEDSVGPPNPSSDSWEYYLGSLNPINSAEDLIKPENGTKLVQANAVREYLQGSIPGTNSDGTLKLWTSGPLDEIVINSKFQVEGEFLLELKSEDPSSIPFTPDTEKLYIITTLGNFSGVNLQDRTLFHQELFESDSLGNSNTWYRTGPSLKTAVWKTIQINKNAGPYVTYIEETLERLNIEKSLYQDFLNDLKWGNYKIWKSIPKSNINIASSKLVFSNSSEDYSLNKHYKVYFYTTELGNIYRDSIDINPSDHSELLVGETLLFKRAPGLELNKTLSTKSELVIPANVTLTCLMESNTFIA